MRDLSREAIERELMSLTPRQFQVLQAVSEGKTNKQIAVQFGLSEKTIKNHRYRICRKLKLRGRNSLYQFSLQAFMDF